MLAILLALGALAQDESRLDLVRVEDPSHPGALATSATGAVLLGPPEAGTPWTWEDVPHVDRVEHEGVAAMNADLWHEHGVLGEGVRVAVFDLQWFGAEADPEVLGAVQTWDCWAHPSCDVRMDTSRPRFGYEEGSHGYGCAEVIHQLAPEVELHLVRVNGRTTLENAVDWAVREGVDLVSLSMSFFNSSYYDGTGRISDLMEPLVAGGTLMVTSSGNYARSHWEGAWTDGDGDGRHDFDGAGGLWVYLTEGEARVLYITWDQFRSCGSTDLDVFVFDEEGWVVGRSQEDQLPDADHCSPLERVEVYVEQTGWHWLEVHHRRGELVNLRLRVVASGGQVWGAVPRGSIADPGASEHVLTVGAVSVHGYLDNDVEPFSSQGPTAQGLSKPEIAGPDGLSTDAYGPAGFYGTSASTPAVTGVLALIMSEEPGLSPSEAAERLQGWAWTEQIAWEQPDPRWGAGKARLPAPEPAPGGCGRGRLWMSLVLLPLPWLRRRRRS